MWTFWIIVCTVNYVEIWHSEKLYFLVVKLFAVLQIHWILCIVYHRFQINLNGNFDWMDWVHSIEVIGLKVKRKGYQNRMRNIIRWTTFFRSITILTGHIYTGSFHYATLGSGFFFVIQILVSEIIYIHHLCILYFCTYTNFAWQGFFQVAKSFHATSCCISIKLACNYSQKIRKNTRMLLQKWF